jgi:hypothetical protein
MKCHICRSCTVRVIYNNENYNVCKLCKKVWSIRIIGRTDAKVFEITDESQREEILKTIDLSIL